jgi:hypothetical protein
MFFVVLLTRTILFLGISWIVDHSNSRNMSDNLKKYQDMLVGLQKEISDQHVPKIDQDQESIFLEACVALADATFDRDLADQARNAAKDDDAKAAANEALDEAEKVLEDTLEMLTLASHPILSSLENSVLNNDDLDRLTVPCAVLFNATPQGLDDFCKSDAESKMVDDLLNNHDLMKSMLEAGGANGGKYGEAVKIFNGILDYSSNVQSQDILRRLALGTCLELAIPMTEFDLPDVQVDPLLRYSHYEQAYLFGELDPSFEQRTAFECRYVVDCDAPNDQLGWGREMLRNYRPDQVTMDDYAWRYVMSVRTEVGYRPPTWTASPRTYQQMISGGGECGPRAWFGRFACKTFGIPTWGVRQPGHACLTHWTPTSWIVCLGADWKFSNWNGRCGPDFYLETQARAHSDYIKVLRLQWIADSMGEAALDQNTGLVNPKCFWRSLALMQARTLAAKGGCNMAIVNDESNMISRLIATKINEEKVHIMRTDGTMIIPATTCTQPTQSTNNAIFQKSFLGGTQLHIREDQSVEYTIDVADSDTYLLSLQICNVHLNQQPLLLTAASDDNETVDVLSIVVPYTVGAWQHTSPVEMILAQGMNILTFTRETPNFGLTIKYLTLKPVNAKKKTIRVVVT